ncbi:MAG: transporter substrate-binding domain-containing protein [Synergistaceae bacterium]|nr:transporter substrate-binding domain-containing protein [Synergistaceae bacterium]MBR0094398.1 transporter substrate-binding domain-containing protein [Synergistaceae bacterium]
MKKFLCFCLLIALMANSACALEKRVIKLGLLSKLNSSEEQFLETWKKTFAPKNENLDIIVKFYDNLNAMQMALNAREIHEMVLPDVVANYMMSKNDEYVSRMVLRSKGMGLAFGFREDSKGLRDDFESALTALRYDWTLEALEGVYIASTHVDEADPVEFAKFENADTIKVAITGDLPPIDFVAADGTPAGFNTALLAEIGAYLKKNIELINIESGARTAALASGRVDVVFWYEVDMSSDNQSDVPDGVILSSPYFEWNRFIHLRKIEREPSSFMFDWSMRDFLKLR